MTNSRPFEKKKIRQNDKVDQYVNCKKILINLPTASFPCMFATEKRNKKCKKRFDNSLKKSSKKALYFFFHLVLQIVALMAQTHFNKKEHLINLDCYLPYLNIGFPLRANRRSSSSPGFRVFSGNLSKSELIRRT